MPTALRRFSLLACVLAALAACAAVMGYAFDSTAPITIAAGLKGMSLPTALSLMLLSGAVASFASPRARLARPFAAAAALIGATVVLSYALFGADVLSAAAQRAVFGSAVANLGRTSPATALCILLVACATWFRRVRPGVSDPIAGAATAISGIALMGYAYGVEDLYRIPIFNTMAVNTAASLFALALATMAADPASGWARVIAHRPDRGEAYARRLLGFVVLAPVTGEILVKATSHGLIGFGAAMAVLVAALAIPLAWLALRDGRVRMSLDAERRRRIDLQAGLAAELERRLAEKMTQLEIEVAERAKAEEIAHRSQRMEAVGRLTGGIAHDFNNLLQALSGNVAIIQRGLPEGDKLRRFADNAEKAVKKGAKLTGQLLTFSRSQRLSLRPVLLRAVIQDSCELIGQSLGPQVSLETHVPVEALWAIGDAQQLELALVNLALNARDAMPRGGTVRISAGVSPPPPGKADGRFVSVRVADNGEGMSPEVASRAGEPFYSTKAQGKGTGLGLAQVFGFARQCGGDVLITTALGAGAIVEIILPAAEPGSLAVGEAQPAVDAPRSHGVGRRVIVIDDDEAVRAVLARGLSDAGYDVAEAVDGPSGLALINARVPEVAVIDFMMPAMTGAEVARRAQAAHPGLPVVFVTGYSDTLALDGIAGATVLKKPFDVEELLAAVKRAMDV